jgi:hypothetical protein
MGEIHKLLKEHGKQGVLQLDLDRRVIDAAAHYMGVEDGEIGFLYSGWAQSALPHRRLDDKATWQVRTDYVSLIVQPGLRHSPEGDPIPVGVPYGTRARLICLYLQSEALRTNSREIELGPSLHAWLRRMKIPIGGKSMLLVRDQAERIARCRMSFQIQRGGRTGLVNQNLLDTALFVDEYEGGRPGQFLERAKLSEMFFEQLRRHPVPVEEAAIASLANNSLAMDTYCWLAYRLHALDKPTPVPWKSLHSQFGAAVARTCDFKPHFKQNLVLALSVYPDAKVEIEERGVVLFPSRPPVSAKVISLAVRPRLKA